MNSLIMLYVLRRVQKGAFDFRRYLHYLLHNEKYNIRGDRVQL
jgi:hypothetical protein